MDGEKNKNKNKKKKKRKRKRKRKAMIRLGLPAGCRYKACRPL